jgi:phosphoglycolate phosphatase
MQPGQLASWAGTSPDPEWMKPSPYLVRAAVSIRDAYPAECAFVGDNTSDLLAGRLAGVPVIGYANKRGKAELLRQAGADAVATGLDEITTAVRLIPPSAARG